MELKLAYMTTLKGKKTNATAGVLMAGAGSYVAALAISGHPPGVSRKPPPQKRFIGFKTGFKKLDAGTRVLSGIWGGLYLAGGMNSLNEARKQYTKGHRRAGKFFKKIRA